MRQDHQLPWRPSESVRSPGLCQDNRVRERLRAKAQGFGKTLDHVLEALA